METTASKHVIMLIKLSNTYLVCIEKRSFINIISIYQIKMRIRIELTHFNKMLKLLLSVLDLLKTKTIMGCPSCTKFQNSTS